jgi:transposase
MPPQRRALQELDQNVRRRPNLTIQERDNIIGMLYSGMGVVEVAKHYGRTERCIRDLRTKYSQTGTTKDKPRSGRPPILSLHQKKIIYQKARAVPKLEYSELAKVGTFVNADGTPSKPPSHATLYGTLKRQGLSNYRCKVHPKLNRGHALKRMKFCKDYCHFSWGRRTLKLSDECSVQKGSGHNTEWCFRLPWEKWKKEMITEVSTSRKPAQMVWASIWLDKRGRGRRSNLIIMDRNNNAPRGGHSSQSYMKALRKGLLLN